VQTDQTTEVVEVPVTAEVNCWFPPWITVEVAGATTTLIAGLFPPQAAANPAASSAALNFQTLIPTPPHDSNASVTIAALPALDPGPEL